MLDVYKEDSINKSEIIKKLKDPLKFMEYGLSALKDKNENDTSTIQISTKIKDSEDKVEMLLRLIEGLASDNHINQKKGNYNKGILHNKNNHNTHRRLCNINIFLYNCSYV